MSSGARRRAGRRAAASRAAVFVFLAAALRGPAVAAPSTTGISLDPARQEFLLSPGGVRRYRFRVTNPDPRRDAALSFRVVDIDSAADGSIDIPEGPVPVWSAADWITLSRTAVVLRPGERAAIPYEVRVPATARGGGYAAVLVESGVPARGRTGRSILIGMRIPYVILVTVRGTERPAVRPVRITPAAGPFIAGSPRTYFVALRNTGNILLRPRGGLTVETAEGSATVPINPRQLALLPGAIRIFEVPVHEPAGPAPLVRAVLQDEDGPDIGAVPSAP